MLDLLGQSVIGIKFFNLNIISLDIATITGMLYILLISKKKRIGWLFGAFSSFCLIFMYWQRGVFFHSLEQIFYFSIGVVGFLKWTNEENPDNQKLDRIKRLPVKYNIAYLLGTFAISYTLYMIFSSTNLVIFSKNLNTIQLLDIYTTVIIIGPTIMQLYKYLDNWFYWLYVNTLVIVLDYKNAMYSIIILIMVYNIMALYGAYTWIRLYKRQQNNA